MIDLSPELWVILMFGGLMIGLFLGHPLAFVIGGLAVIFGILSLGPQCFPMFINRIYGNVMDSYVLIAVPLFIFMALLLNLSGVTDEVFELAHHFLRRVKGGLAVAVIVVSTIFAACTGITGASIVTMGLLTLPLMLKYGYKKEMSVGTVCAGGTLGILIPPSIMLVFMGSETGLSVGDLFAAAIIPGLILSCLYCIYILIYCFFTLKETETILVDDELSSLTGAALLKRTSKALVPPVLLILGVLGSIFLGVATPTEAAGVGSLCAFVLVLAYDKFSWTSFSEVVLQTSRVTSMALIIVVGTTCFTGVFLVMGGGEVVEKLLLGTGLGKWGIFCVMMLIIFFMGMFLDWIGIVMITFPFMLPIAEHLGFDKLWFTTICAVVLQTSFLTPPFGYALFYIKAVAPPEVEMHHVYRGIVPFVILILCGVIICCIFPETITWLPSVLVK